MNLPDDTNTFVFDQEYLADPQRPVLSQFYLNDDASLNDDRTSNQHVRRLAPPFFSNLLPEGALRKIISRRLGVSEERDFPLLAHLGEHLIGATRLIGTQNAPQVEPRDVIALAIPGVQLKLSVVYDDEKLTLPCGDKEGQFIAKVSTGALPGIVENEYSMLLLAKLVGIPVPEIRLANWDEIEIPGSLFNAQGQVLLVRRFDRAGQQRIHTEDFNQVFGQFPHDKYEHHSLSDVARVLFRRAALEEVADFIKRIVFSAAIANGDMHLKNWSLIYHDGRTPGLSPAYDFVSTLPYGTDSNLGLSFGGSKHLNILDADRQKVFAEKADIPLAFVKKQASEMVERLREAWRSFEGPMLDDHRAKLDAHLKEFYDSRVPDLRVRRVRLG